MGITKEEIQDKIEVVGEFKHIQVRTATIIKENDKESADVKAMVKQFHTDAVKKAYAEHLKNNTP